MSDWVQNCPDGPEVRLQLYPESGLKSDTAGGLFRAITGLMRRSKQHCSITSSAQTSNEGGPVRPSALAIFKLITHLVFGRLLHRQVGSISTLRILST